MYDQDRNSYHMKTQLFFFQWPKFSDTFLSNRIVSQGPTERHVFINNITIYLS